MGMSTGLSGSMGMGLGSTELSSSMGMGGMLSSSMSMGMEMGITKRINEINYNTPIATQ